MRVKLGVDELKKSKVALIVISLVILVVISLFVYNISDKEKTSEDDITAKFSQDERDKTFKEVEELEEILFQENGLLEQVNERLEEEGYEFIILLSIFSKNEIWVKYALSNKEATEQEQEEVKSIFYELLEKNNMDSSAFKLKVSNDDSPDW